jgi:hypothetical protein
MPNMRGDHRELIRGRASSRRSVWLKTIGLLRKTKLRGLDKIEWLAMFGSAFNLIRLPKLCRGRHDEGDMSSLGDVGIRSRNGPSTSALRVFH